MNVPGSNDSLPILILRCRQPSAIIACQRRLHEDDADSEAYSRKLEHIHTQWEKTRVDEAARYQLDIAGLSSTKRRGFGIPNFCWWKLFYSDVGVTMLRPVLVFW
ncbi:unnamed protein product [Soboliphyme baturini]|uniref:Uncharacterized protein n=1 Tax=Soboliphyme baturini TaxID=241478 RepID=A0A183J1Y0_9BILA|nr:unnamed protein product [Soboliphyme baturini]